MTYYVIRVAPRGELKFIAMAKGLLGQASAEVIFPRKKMINTRRGLKVEEEIPLFPGYVFLRVDELSSDLRWELKKTSGFFHFLRQGETVSTLSEKDLELLKHFLSFGEVVGKSRVVFNENHRIEILSGPLKGLEGQIIKVDRRKQRAKVALSLQHAHFLVDLSFEDLSLKEPLS